MRRATFLTVALSLALGCERIVDIDLPVAPPRLVVQARIELVKGTNQGHQTIRLTTTTAVTDTGALPPASGATVVILDEQGHGVTFTESSEDSGLYETDALVPTAGTEYTLEIDYQGEHYRGIAVLNAAPAIDSLYFIDEPGGPGQGDAGLRAAIDYTDPAGQRNFYLWEELIDGKRQALPDPGNQFRIIGADDYYDGETVTGWEPYDEAIVKPGQRVVIRQLGLDEAGYRYYLALFEQTAGGQGSPFGVPPASLRGNVINLTDESHYPLGYFLATEVAETARTAE